MRRSSSHRPRRGPPRRLARLTAARGGGLAVLDELPASRELAVDALEVRAHGIAGLARVVDGKRLEDRTVIVDGRRLQLGGAEVLLHEPPDRAAAAIPEVLDDDLEDAVARRRCDGDVEV